MKKFILIIASGLLLFASCSDSFFEKYPTDSMSSDNYCNSIDEVRSVLDGAYAGMRGNFGNDIVYIGDLPTDNAYDYKLNNSTAHITMHESSVNSQNTIMSDLWYACYQVINRSNIVIESMTAKFSDNKDYNQFVGEAKFLRAYAYYVMVRVYGGVPIVLVDIVNYMDVFKYGRSTVDEVYSQIVSDLDDAASKLPDSYSANPSKGRASAIAANAILGDVYLTRKDYSKAKTYFEAVIAKEGANLGLIDGKSYGSIFSATNVNNKEVIFAIQYGYGKTPEISNYLGRASLGNVQGIAINPPGYTGSKIYGVNILMMTSELEAKFAAEDLRRSVIYTDLLDPSFANTPIPLTLKYFDYRNITDGKSGNSPESGCPTIISRYADIILKYAECLNESDPAAALAQVKRIRDRAGVTTDVAANKDAVALAIETERQLELNMEGHRWFDIVRTGRAQEVMNAFYLRGATSELPNTIAIYQYGDLVTPATVSNDELLYPLPYAQVVLNPDKLTQNPGY